MKALSKKERAEKVANKMIKTLQEAGYNYDDMIRVIRLARHKFNYMKRKQLKTECA